MGKAERVVVAFAAVVAALLLPPFGGAAPTAAAAATNCTRSCGNISVPYPFGIEPGCYHATWFNLTCDLAFRPPKLFLGDGTVQVLEISAPNATVRINSSRVEFARRGGGGDGRAVNGTWGLGRLPQDGPYFLSEDTNMLLVESCNVQAVVRGGEENSLVASCSSVCPPAYQDGKYFGYLVGVRGGCIGIGCCQANIYIGYSFYSIQINKLDGSFDPGTELSDYIYIVDQGNNYTIMNETATPETRQTLNWMIAYNMTCPTNASAPECRSAYSSCLNTSDYAMGPAKGYKCQCSHGYQGNPYIADGCQDIDECNNNSSMSYPCYGDCKNTPGSFVCLCPAGFEGNASVPNGCQDIDECQNKESHGCYGECRNFQGTFQCQCPNGTYGSPFIKDGCVTITKKNSFTGDNANHYVDAHLLPYFPYILLLSSSHHYMYSFSNTKHALSHYKASVVIQLIHLAHPFS